MKRALFRIGASWMALIPLVQPVLADDAADIMNAISDICIDRLENGRAIGAGLDRANAAMENKLLNGKAGKIWRLNNQKVVIVEHDSGETCEVMAIGVDPSDVGAALQVWMGFDGQAFTIDPEYKLPAQGSGGAYLARQLENGDFLQVFVQSQAEAKFVGMTASRVQDSVQARELLGL